MLVAVPSFLRTEHGNEQNRSYFSSFESETTVNKLLQLIQFDENQCHLFSIRSWRT